MTATKKFLVAVLLGVTAAGLNAYLLSKKLDTKKFVIVKAKQIELGDTFTREHLTELELPMTYAGADAALVPGEKIDLVVGQTAQRPYLEGDVIFWRDITPAATAPQITLKEGEELVLISLAEIAYEPELLVVDNEVKFVQQTISKNAERTAAEAGATDVTYLGPFRIVSVGAKLDAEVAEDEEDSRIEWNTEARTVGLAIPANLDANSKSLLAATDRRADGPVRITHIILHGAPAKKTPPPSPGAATSPRPQTTSTAGP
jgi:hypothetical protein